MTTLAQLWAEGWPKLRGVLALDGVNVHTFTAADQISVCYQMLRRQFKAAGDTQALRELFELTGDRDALGALDREIMGQTGGVEYADVPVRR